MKATSGTNDQRGFTLLEVLIAMLILGVAVMGFAGLQVRALQSTGTAHLRSQAMTLAADLAERMHANPSALSTYNTPSNWTASLPTGAPTTWNPPCMLSSSSVGAPGCTPSQMALFDIEETRFLANQLLPAGTASATCTAGTGGSPLCTVYLGWSGSVAGTTSGTGKCSANTDTNCVTMQVMPPL